jgi:hypothetical protein
MSHNYKPTVFSLADFRHMSAISLIIEECQEVKEWREVCLFFEDDIGGVNWWSIFRGTESECEYFVDNFNKGMAFILGVEK